MGEKKPDLQQKKDRLNELNKKLDELKAIKNSQIKEEVFASENLKEESNILKNETEEENSERFIKLDKNDINHELNSENISDAEFTDIPKKETEQGYVEVGKSDKSILSNQILEEAEKVKKTEEKKTTQELEDKSDVKPKNNDISEEEMKNLVSETLKDHFKNKINPDDKEMDSLISETSKDYFKNKEKEKLKPSDENFNGEDNKEKEEINKLDIEKSKKEISERINEEEKEKGEAYTEEEIKDRKRELSFEIKEESIEKAQKNSKIPNQTWDKTKEWWKGLDKKAIGKATGQALLLSGITIGLGATLGITPTNFGSIAVKMGWRGLSAAGMNMGVSSNLAKKFLNKKEEDPNEKKSWIKREMNLGNAAAALGITLSAVLSAGTAGIAVPLIGVGGYAFRRGLNWYFDSKIKKLENENTKESIAKAKNLKLIKNTIGGAGIIAAGLGTMAIYHHNQIEVEQKHQEEIKHENDIKQQKEELSAKKESENFKEFKKEQENFLKHKIEEQIKLKDMTVGDGEGIEHTLIRQIEHNGELAKELGFKGDINDAKALHEFAGREAHIIAKNEGYVDNAGHEVRVTEANKVTYEIKMENGHIIVEEKTVSGELLETHHKGDKFEEKTDKYEYNDGKDHRLDHQQENIDQTHTETDTEKQIINEYEDTSKTTGGEYIDTSKSDQVIEYDDTSKPTGEQHIPSNIETEPLNVKIGEHIYTTEEDWAKAPENIYHIPLKDLTQINEIHNSNINHITSQTSNEEELQKVQSTLKEGHADAMVGIKETEVNEIYRPIHNYINKLHDVTGLEPIGETHLHAAETDIDYTHRAEMKAAEMHRLNEIKLNNRETLDQNKTEEYSTGHEKELQNLSKDIPIQKNEHFPLVNSIKAHFSYDKSGNPIKIETNASIVGSESEFFGKNFRKEIIEWSKENKKEMQFEIDKATLNAKNLYINLATYDNITKNIEYIKESEFLKNMITKEITELSKYGDKIIDFEKLPKEFQPK